MSKADWFGENGERIARTKQIPPRWPDPDWDVWLIMTGRCWGKNRTASETIKKYVENDWAGKVALIGPTFAHASGEMAGGPSGVLGVYDKEEPNYIISKGHLVWPSSCGYVYGVQNDGLEGFPEHIYDLIWIDEITQCAEPASVWQTVLKSLNHSESKNPQVILTTTPPKDPPEPIPTLAEEAGCSDRVVMTRGSTLENKDNLSYPTFRNLIINNAGTNNLDWMLDIEGQFVESVEEPRNETD